MRNCEETEEDREDHPDIEVGRVVPEGIAGVGGDVTMGGRDCV